MIRINASDIMHPTLLIGAKCFHQLRGDTRITVPKMLTVSRHEDGSGAEIYLLTRFTTAKGKAMSAIMAWDPRTEAVCHEVHSVERKKEPKMLATWQEKLEYKEK